MPGKDQHADDRAGNRTQQHRRGRDVLGGAHQGVGLRDRRIRHVLQGRVERLGYPDDADREHQDTPLDDGDIEANPRDDHRQGRH